MKFTRQTTAPSQEPIAIAEMVSHLRAQPDSAEQLLIASYLAAARETVENFTGRALVTAGYTLVSDSWTDCEARSYAGYLSIILPRSPLISVATVKYWPDGGGSRVTLTADTDYAAITGTLPGMVLLKIDPPALAARPDAVEIVFTAGYATPPAVPAVLRHATMLMTTNLYELRAPINVGNIVNEIPLGLRHLLESQRVNGWIG